MKVSREVIDFEAIGHERIQQAIDEAVDALLVEANGRFKGRLIEFQHRWHPIYDTVTIQVPIAGVLVELGGLGNSINLRFEVCLRDPRNGQRATVEVSPDLCRLI